MKEPTKKQLDFIEFIEEWTIVKFSGKTRQEASDYIDENKSKIPIDAYTSDWSIINGY